MMLLTDEQIDYAKKNANLQLEGHHEHNDCIRIAYGWLDAQRKIKNPTRVTFALKHIIENWGGRYVSQSDVEVAAWLHPEIRGVYPNYNISSRLTLPSKARLSGVGEAGKHPIYQEKEDLEIYKNEE